MRNVTIKIVLLIVLILSIWSCKKDDEPIDTPVKTTKPQDEENTSQKIYLKKIVIEDFTSTGCPYCPPIARFLDNLSTRTDVNYVIPVAIYCDFYSNSPMISKNSSNLKSQLEVSGFPSVYVNRENFNAYRSVKSFKNKLKKQGSAIGIKVSSELKTTNGTVNFDLKLNSSLTGLKYSIYILESGHKEKQAGAGVITHNNFIRVIGADRVPFEIKKGETKSFSKSINFNLISKNLNNVDVVVYITDKNGFIIQAQIAKANKTADFSLIK